MLGKLITTIGLFFAIVTSTLASGNIVGPRWPWYITAGGEIVPLGFRQYSKIEAVGYDKSETLTNYPLMISLSKDTVVGFSYDAFTNLSVGTDLRFFDNTTTNPLEFEIDWYGWDTNVIYDYTPPLVAWVRIPTFTSNTVVWAAWGATNTNTVVTSTNGAVWTNTYYGVYHQNSTTLLKDATRVRDDGWVSEVNGLVDTATGKGIDYGGNTGNGSASIGLNNLGTATRSLEVFAKRTYWKSESDSIARMLTMGSEASMIRFENTFSTFKAYVRDSGDNYNQLGWNYSLPYDRYNEDRYGGTWHHYVMTYTNSDFRLYIDGVVVTQNTLNITLRNNDEYININAGGSEHFSGSMDEGRVGKGALSSNWVWATYMSVLNTKSLLKYGDAPKYEVPSYFTKKMKITFTGFNNKETLKNFPIAVRLSTAISGFDYNTFSNTAGADLRFYDSSGLTELYHEDDIWDTSGTSIVWVAATIKTNTDYIWAAWGCTNTASEPEYSKNGYTFGNYYTLAMHFSTNNDGTSSGSYIYTNSASGRYNNNNRENARDYVAATGKVGVVGKGQEFPGIAGQYVNNRIDLQNGGNEDTGIWPYDHFSFSVWVKPRTNVVVKSEGTWPNLDNSTREQSWVVHAQQGQGDVGIWPTYGTAGFGLSVGTNAAMVFALGGNYYPSLCTYSNVHFQDWTHIAIVVTNRTPDMYVNGVKVRTGTQAGQYLNFGYLMARFSVGWTDGSSDWGGYNGYMDELWLTRYSVTSNWVYNIYSNQAIGSSYLTYGTVQ